MDIVEFETYNIIICMRYFLAISICSYTNAVSRSNKSANVESGHVPQQFSFFAMPIITSHSSHL